MLALWACSASWRSSGRGPDADLRRARLVLGQLERGHVDEPPGADGDAHLHGPVVRLLHAAGVGLPAGGGPRGDGARGVARVEAHQARRCRRRWRRGRPGRGASEREHLAVDALVGDAGRRDRGHHGAHEALRAAHVDVAVGEVGHAPGQRRPDRGRRSRAGPRARAGARRAPRRRGAARRAAPAPRGSTRARAPARRRPRAGPAAARSAARRRRPRRRAARASPRRAWWVNAPYGPSMARRVPGRRPASAREWSPRSLTVRRSPSGPGRPESE